MKRILSFLVILTLTLSASALQPQRGYRGFIDWDNNLFRETLWEGYNKTYYYTGVSTSHGYQFNPNFYLGAGLSLTYNNFSETWVLPVFLEARTDQKFGKFTPFGDLRVGWSLTDGGGLYAQPMIGYRFNWGRKMGVNIGIGMTFKSSRIDIVDINFDPEHGYMTWEKIGTETRTKLMFAFRVGIDF